MQQHQPLRFLVDPVFWLEDHLYTALASSSRSVVTSYDIVASSSQQQQQLQQLMALALVPKCTAFLSILAEIWIIVEVGTCPCKRRQVYHRLLLGFSIMDLLQTIWLFASTWPIPKTNPSQQLLDQDEHGTLATTTTTDEALYLMAYGNIGNQATCTAQGFFIQLGEAVPFYFCSLIIYYYLAIRLGRHEQSIRHDWEVYLHAVPLCFAFGSALAGIFLDLYNNAGSSWCWIAPLPFNCLRDSQSPHVKCLRGQHAEMFQFVFSFIPIWICAVVVLICMGRIYCGVRHQEVKSRRYRHIQIEHGSEVDVNDQEHFRHDNNSNNNQCCSSWWHYKQYICCCCGGDQHCPRSGQVASQAMYYVAAFYLSYSFGTLNRLITHFAPSTGVTTTTSHPSAGLFAVQLLQVFFQPLQGVFNFLIYRRPTYLRLRKKEQLSRCSAFWQVMQWSFLNGHHHHHHNHESQSAVSSLFSHHLHHRDHSQPQQQHQRPPSTEQHPSRHEPVDSICCIAELERRCIHLAKTDIIEHDDEEWLPRTPPPPSSSRGQVTKTPQQEDQPVRESITFDSIDETVRQTANSPNLAATKSVGP